MIGYKGVTWCEASTCVHFKTCSSAYTPEVREAADKWWGRPRAPVITFVEPEKHLKCYEKGDQLNDK